MIILPAIDIIDRKPVRLYQGDYAQKEIVGSSVMELAKNFEQSGAEYIHLVDLDGAKEGKRVNHEIILETAHALDVPVEVGGGIRTMAQIESYLECPYKWFAQRRLRLEGLDEGFGPLQMGDFAHSALKSFYAHFQEEVAPKVTRGTIDSARAIMRDVLDRHESHQYDLKPSDNRLVPTTELERRDVDSLKRKLLDYLDYEAELLPTFHPVYLE